MLAFTASNSAAYTAPKPPLSSVRVDAFSSRRAFLSNLAIASAASFGIGSNFAPANAADAQLQDVYFGAGCFWHVQHEFVEAERKLLNRKDKELTSRTGYAGGLKTDGEGRVCYHNFQSIADYGKLGHGEVVGMTIPESSIGDFAVEYFKLFGEKGGKIRVFSPFMQKKRSLLGLPGGTSHPMYAQVEAAGKVRGMTLVAGKGDEPDTLGKRLVYVYDSNKFPFYQAEVCKLNRNEIELIWTVPEEIVSSRGLHIFSLIFFQTINTTTIF
ncbi:hypothetical protein ACHAXS_011008 [Conticribra weissflogii]